MTPRPDGWLALDERGRLELPPNLAARLGLKPGGRAAYLLRDGDLQYLRILARQRRRLLR